MFKNNSKIRGGELKILPEEENIKQLDQVKVACVKLFKRALIVLWLSWLSMTMDISISVNHDNLQ